MIKLAIFDLDGTLLNTIEDIAGACNHTLKTHGFPTKSLEEITQLVGYGVRNLVERALPADTNPTEAELDGYLGAYINYYREHQLDKTTPYLGIPQLLNNLLDKGVTLAVLSNKTHANTVAIAQHFFPTQFADIYGQREGIPRKPDPHAINLIVEQHGLSNAQVIYIGDSEADVAAALAAEVHQASVTWGFRTLEQLVSAGSTHNFDTADLLFDHIVSL